MTRPTVAIVVQFLDGGHMSREVGYGDTEPDVVYRVVMNGVTDAEHALRLARAAHQRAREGYPPGAAPQMGGGADGFQKGEGTR